MAEIDVRIENWKKRLLDLGKRNRLINYKETKRSNIKIISPDLADLYETLVTKEIALSFPQPLDEYYDEYDEESYGAVSYGDIETDRNIKEQQKTLSNLRAKSKTAIEEQGINILYLCFGFLICVMGLCHGDGGFVTCVMGTGVLSYYVQWIIPAYSRQLQFVCFEKVDGKGF